MTLQRSIHVKPLVTQAKGAQESSRESYKYNTLHDPSTTRATLRLGKERQIQQLPIYVLRRSDSLAPRPECSCGDLIPLREPYRSRLAARHLETFSVTPGDNGLSPTLKAVPNCDIS
jgi:hypothetical protein